MSKEIIGNNIVYMNNQKHDSLLLYIHGGSFVDKPMKMQIKFVKRVADRLKMSLAVPIYTTLPKGNVNIFMKDMISVYKLLLNRYSKIYLIGDSAGGGAVISLSMVISENGIKKPEGIIALSPWLDLSLENVKIKQINDIVCSLVGNKYCGKLWADNNDIKDYKVSSIYGDFINTDKIFITCGGNEICQPDCEKLDLLLDSIKKDHRFFQFENQFHNFEIYPIKESKIVIDEIYKYYKGEEKNAK